MQVSSSLMAKCLKRSLNRHLSTRAQPTLAGASVLQSFPSGLRTGASTCSGGGCIEGRALECFKNSRKLKTGLSQGQGPCKDPPCFRGVQGKWRRSVRYQDQVPFAEFPGNSNGRQPRAQQGPAWAQPRAISAPAPALPPARPLHAGQRLCCP